MRYYFLFFFFSSRRRHTRLQGDWSSDVCSSDLSRGGPTVAIDEAHSNLHTAGGQYKPFADLLTNDGYRVIASTHKFETGTLARIDVLVIANARDLAALRAGNLSSPAFSEHECEVVRDWVRDGGSLLLIADHAPFGNAADNLATRFGVTMGKGWVFDRASPSGITTQLVFSRENGLLGAHPILTGRNASEGEEHQVLHRPVTWCAARCKYVIETQRHCSRS